jgi:hypothetical protein
MFGHRTSVSHNQQQSEIMILGGTMLACGWTVFGVQVFLSDNGANQVHAQSRVNGTLLLVAALLQTLGSMIIAMSDIDVDLFAKRHHMCVLAFALAWIGLNQGLLAMAPPITGIASIHWIADLPFVYLLLRFRAVLQMRSEAYPRFSDLFACSLSLDLIAKGVWHAVVSDGPKGKLQWPHNLVGSVFVSSGVSLFVLYCRLRSKRSNRLALSITLYAYLLAWGMCNAAFK